MNHYAVIMAGGGGTRLWPLSRQSKPKQSLQLLGQRTMFQIAVERLAPLFTPDHILVVTGQNYVADLQAQTPQIPATNFLVEPAPRGTGPAIGLAAAVLYARDPQSSMVCLTADHFIKDEARFRSVLESSLTVAGHGHLVTLGITPTYAATGFGYIQRGESLGGAGAFQAFRAVRFKEKPALPEAEKMLADGLHSWNSGMFIWQVERVLAEFEKQHAGCYNTLKQIAAEPHRLSELWETIPNFTIDYGIMEQAHDVAVIPAEGLGWSDIGSWDALFDLLVTDETPNVHIGQGEVLHIDSRQTLVHSDQPRLIVTIGLDDVVIVDTPDALLVCRRDQAQRVREVMEQLKQLTDGNNYL